MSTAGVTLGPEPVVVMFNGSKAVMLHDDATNSPVLSPVERAVLVARLRAWADVLEVPPGDGP